ncbi:MAG: glycosyltransferase family 4 protein [Acidimicrobiia bacterium]|nr:glycosyltransferase family 4 protein [Acidimicrobiia bacterium]
MIDCIAGYHLNPWTCGIAKFNSILSRELQVPVVGLRDVELGRFRRPLLSIKIEEFSDRDAADLDLWSQAHAGDFELFLHAYGGTEVEQRLVTAAGAVYCGNSELARVLSPGRPDVVELFCPGTILNPQRFQQTEISVFTFGMAHKIRVGLYTRLRDLLEATGRSYSVFVSTALHENTSFDGSFVVRFEELQALFGGHIYFMGYLSDTAVYNHLLDATFLAAFFDKGLRANNTTVNAAMECGCAVITNLDADSPAGLEHGRNIIDISRCDRLPSHDEAARIGRAARDLAHGQYGWDRLVERLRPAVRTGVPAAPRAAGDLAWQQR